MRSRRISVGVFVFALGVAAAGPALLFPTVAAADPACSQQDLTVTCSFPGGISSWTVPDNIVPNSVTTITARGQTGDVGTSQYANGLVASGGRGALVSAGFVLTPGDQFTVTVPLSQGVVSAADPGGGGAGDSVTDSDTSYQSGDGGGFAAVTFPDALGGLVVAGGGGGGGMGTSVDPDGPVPTPLRGGYGGDAGLPGATAGTGATGDANDPLTGGRGGYGGTAADAGGAGAGGTNADGGGGFSSGCDFYTRGVSGNAGVPGRGADAVDPPGTAGGAGGAGGGGYGGGGSAGSGAYIFCSLDIYTAGGGGGGGSSYVDPSAVPGKTTSSIADGKTFYDGGAVTISYPITPPDVTAPVATIDPVTNPRPDAVASLHFQYGEPVTATPDYTLTRDGVDIPDLRVTGFQVDPDNHFIGVTVDVSAVTAAPGVYVFRVPAAGITDLAGNPVAADASITWTNTSVVGTFGAVDSPRASGVGSIPITFTTNVTGVDISDFRVFRDGNPTPLTGATLSGSGANYSIDGLGDLTAPELYPVDWELELRGPDDTGIVNQYGTGAPETSVAFTVEAAAAPTASFTAVDTPRSSALDQAQVTFSEPVYAVDISDFSLTRNGAPLDLSAASVTGQGADYTISGLSDLTAPGDTSADYTLSLRDSGTNITNDEGIALASGASVAFTVAGRPTVTSVSPNTGPAAGGQQVTITGGGFTGATAVHLGGRVRFTVDSDSRITATTAAHAPGPVHVYVTGPAGTNGATPAGSYRFSPVPSLTEVYPSRGPLAGGRKVRISGRGFGGATAVIFGNVAASFTVQSPSTIIATTPAGAAGAVDVTVRTPDGEVTSARAYTFQAAPVITSVVARSGTSAGGESVTITGTDLTGALGVYFSRGTPAAAFHVDSDTQITVTTPAHAPGSVNVRVAGPGGNSPPAAADRYAFIELR